MRLPLDVAESVARRVGVELDDRWLPAVAYEGFEAEAKRALGSILRDDELLEEGRRQRVRAAELRRALELDQTARNIRQRSGRRVEKQREVAGEQPDQIAEAAKELDQSIEFSRARRRQRVEARAGELEEAAETLEEARDDEVARQELLARQVELAEESAALEKEQRAVSAKGRVRALDEAEKRLSKSND